MTNYLAEIFDTYAEFKQAVDAVADTVEVHFCQIREGGRNKIVLVTSGHA